MPLSKEERIATIGLLIKREAEYARVDGIEVKTNQFLQGDCAQRDTAILYEAEGAQNIESKESTGT